MKYVPYYHVFTTSKDGELTRLFISTHDREDAEAVYDHLVGLGHKALIMDGILNTEGL